MTSARAALPAICLLLLLLLAPLMGGCRLCADCDLESYPSYGGAWQRTLRDSGRVGSLFDPGGSRASDLSQRADPDAADAMLRRDDGDDSDQRREEEDAEDLEKDEKKSIPEGEKTQEDRDRELEEMQERLEKLDLQDIDYRKPPPVSFQ